jgi:hypothetical protein
LECAERGGGVPLLCTFRGAARGWTVTLQERTQEQDRLWPKKMTAIS